MTQGNRESGQCGGSRDRDERHEDGKGMEPKETVLVTGATGFLGQYLVRRLAGRYRVLALGRDREKGKRLEQLGATFCPGDFTDGESCAGYFNGVKYVIHAGALSTVWGRWEDFYRTNVLATARIAGWCREKGVRRLVYISSPSIYTEMRDQYGIREEDAPVQNDLNGYIRSKLMGEREIHKWESKGLETVILRPRGLIGIGDNSLVPRLLRANAGIGLPLFRGGCNLVDLTSVENVAQACELAMTAEGASGQIFNITNGEPAEFGELLEQFLSAAGETPHYRRLPFGLVYCLAAGLERIYRLLRLSGEPPLTRYTVCTLGFAQTMDISRARKILKYQPEKALKESIQEYGEWWRMQKEGKELPQKNDQNPEKIKSVTIYHCGYCVNDLGVMFRGRKREKRCFPASAVLICHRELGNILYDTGYSEAIFGKGIFLRLYRSLNPVVLNRGERIDERLAGDGICPESVRKIILSHAHPDHIGGLAGFDRYELITSAEVKRSIKRPGISSLVLTSQLPPPEKTIHWCVPERTLDEHFLCRYFEKVYDLFGDGSVIGVELRGHCRGQMGLWIPDMRLFLAADACWGKDLVRDTGRMRQIPRLIQDNFSQYQKTLRKICLMKKEHPEINVVFSHQQGKERRFRCVRERNEEKNV